MRAVALWRTWVAPVQRSDLDALRLRSGLFARATPRVAVAAILMALLALAAWSPNPHTNDAFSNVYVTYEFNAAGLSIVNQGDAKFLGLRVELINALLVAFRTLAALSVVVLLLIRRGRWAAIGMMAILLSLGWNTWRWREGFEILSDASRPAILIDHQRASIADPKQRLLINFVAAQAAYIEGDAKRTAQALSRMDPAVDFPINAARWRVSVMRDWVKTHGQTVEPGALDPRPVVPLALRRFVAFALCLAAMLSWAASATLGALALAIQRRVQRLATT